jgi:hypothetical protein
LGISVPLASRAARFIDSDSEGCFVVASCLQDGFEAQLIAVEGERYCRFLVGCSSFFDIKVIGLKSAVRREFVVGDETCWVCSKDISELNLVISARSFGGLTGCVLP